MGFVDVDQVLATPLNPGLGLKRRLEYGESRLGGGGFGEVYPVLSLDGRRPAEPLVVKFFHVDSLGLSARCFNTVQKLQRQLDQQNAMLRGTSLDKQYPALYAVPQISFKGRRGQEVSLGYCTRDLAAAGLSSFGALLEDGNRLGQLQDLPMPAKFAMAAQLVDALHFLYSKTGYIHADLKADNLFVNLERASCAIIDFDSGALGCDDNDIPTTPGTLQGWLAPEIFRQLRSNRRSMPTHCVNLFSEFWSVAVGIHYILFGFHPFFFLSELSDRSAKEYFNCSRWPQPGPACQYYLRKYDSQHKEYIKFLNTHVPRPVLEQFEATFNAGYFDPKARASYGQWKQAFDAVRRQRPVIVYFRASHPRSVQGQPIRLEWSVQRAKKIEIAPKIGDVTGRDHVKVLPLADTNFTLTATSWFGASVQQTVSVQVARIPPRIVAFGANPAAVRFGQTTELYWEVDNARRVRIAPGLGEVAARGRQIVRPTQSLKFELVAESPSGAIARAHCTVDLLHNTPLPAPTPLAKRASGTGAK